MCALVFTGLNTLVRNGIRKLKIKNKITLEHTNKNKKQVCSFLHWSEKLFSICKWVLCWNGECPKGLRFVCSKKKYAESVPPHSAVKNLSKYKTTEVEKPVLPKKYWRAMSDNGKIMQLCIRVDEMRDNHNR